MDKSSLVTYEELAHEYYDAQRHPTCANLRDGSRLFLSQHIEALLPGTNRILEIGAGKSLAAEMLSQTNFPLQNLYLADSSKSMLSKSALWAEFGTHMVLASSESLPFSSNSFSIIISSLGDPYNTQSFWSEVFRLLVPYGTCLYTTPAYQWALAFRSRLNSLPLLAAEFKMTNGSTVFVPSYVYPESQQRLIIENSGLHVKQTFDVTLRSLDSAIISPKLMIDDEDIPVVTGFVISKEN